MLIIVEGYFPIVASRDSGSNTVCGFVCVSEREETEGMCVLSSFQNDFVSLLASSICVEVMAFWHLAAKVPVT